MVSALLNITEAEALAAHEATIERGLKTFVEVGGALLAIRDARLYRAEYGTFEEYCRERWQMSRIHAHRMIASAGVVTNLLPIGNTPPPASEAQARPLTVLPPEEQPAIWQAAVETAPGGKVTAAHVAEVVRDYQQRQSGGGPLAPPAPAERNQLHQSNSNEWYTPAAYVEAARAVMGGIDLDPASNPLANETVKAARYFTKDDDGLEQAWRGRVWLNPPYGYGESNQSNQAIWSRRLVAEYQVGNVAAAVLLVNATPGNKWFAPLWDFPICFPDHRIRFYGEDGEQSAPTHSNALVYLGPDVERFAETFSRFGVIAVRYESEAT